MGVPVVGCDCEVCTSADPKNSRRRVSIFIEVDGVNLLIDTSPDLRLQLIDNNIKQINGILYTHNHSDHVDGLNDLRRIGYLMEQKLDIYGMEQTLDSLRYRFDHAFGEPASGAWGWYKLSLNPHAIFTDEAFNVKGVEITAFPQVHGRNSSLGFRIGDFAYSTDVNNFSEKCFEEKLSGLDTWVVDCQGVEKSLTHASLDVTLGWIERVKPKRTILTHMSHEFDYDKLKQELPEGVEPAYDNMVIVIS
jgi:phosphoribosyl 1,2-cyclic phosphate phosphodiesterase